MSGKDTKDAKGQPLHTNPAALVPNVPSSASNPGSGSDSSSSSSSSSQASTAASTGFAPTKKVLYLEEKSRKDQINAKIAGRQITDIKKAVLVALNGDLYVPNDEGEMDAGNDLNVVTIHTDKVDVLLDNDIEMIAHEVHDQDPALSSINKNYVLASRISAWKLGLLKPNDASSTHHCRYTEVIKGKYRPEANTDVTWIDYQLLGELLPVMTNVICLVAYIFRWKGHHYKKEYESVYAAKWAKCRNVREDLIRSDGWEFIATRGLHAIFPDDLDNFWLQSVAEGKCARPLAIRMTVPAAGTASFFAMYAGLGEFKQLFPNQASKMKKMIESLEAVVEDLRINRWKGGINRKFYDAGILLVRENDFSALAAAIKGLNTPDGAATDLGASESLTRVAKSAALSTKIWKSVANGVIRAAESTAIQKQLGLSAVTSIVFHGDGLKVASNKPQLLEEE